MHVVATAGHVDHGKSTLVRALTRMEPDRWAEERRRGMTIDLGFAWTTFEGETFAFVDVPGHERFVPNMLAGIGPVPAALIVVAADEGWMPQTEEHVAALDALQVRSAVLAITRCDLADPAGANLDACARLAKTSLGNVEAVAVAVRPDGTTEGLDHLRRALLNVAKSLPKPDRHAPVRLWVDRCFTVRGSGTVVTGTLTAGTVSSQDSLLLASSGREVHVRGLQSLGRQVERVASVARVAVNLRGVDKDDVRRGDALLTPNAWRTTAEVDVLLHGAGSDEIGRELMVHVGSAAVPGRLRPLGTDTARLSLGTPLALRASDLLLLRDPGRHRIVASARVLDAQPAPLTRRGAAAARGRELSTISDDASAELRRRGIARGNDLRAAGMRAVPAPLAGDWLVDAGHAASLRDRLQQLVAQHVQRFPLEPGPSVDAVRRVLDLPDRSLVAALVESAAGSGLSVRDGRVVDTRRENALPPAVAAAVGKVRARLLATPFDAPEAGDLAALGLGPRELAAAERAGELLRIADGVVLLPDAPTLAVERLTALRQPFSVSEARQALRTTRRTAVPLLELLDGRRLTRRHADGSRTVV